MSTEINEQTVNEEEKEVSRKEFWTEEWKRGFSRYARLFSYVFHPLFIPTYAALYLLYCTRYSYADIDAHTKLLRAISVFLMTAFFPAFTVFLLWRLKFVSSVFLRTSKERIIPYMAAMFFYFWMYYVGKNIAGNYAPFLWLLLGTFISSIAALMANIYCKVSMHAIAMGNLLMLFVLLGLGGEALLSDVTTTIYIAGIVLSSRLLVSDHTAFEVYFGFLLGMICQSIAFMFV